MAGVSKEIPRRTKAEKRIARAIEENRKGARNVDASLWRERYGAQSSRSSGRSFERKVRNTSGPSVTIPRTQPAKCPSKLAVSPPTEEPQSLNPSYRLPPSLC